MKSRKKDDPERKKITIEQILSGDPFLMDGFQEGDPVFLKTDTHNGRGAVNLRNGHEYIVATGQSVVPLDGEFIYEYKK